MSTQVFLQLIPTFTSLLLKFDSLCSVVTFLFEALDNVTWVSEEMAKNKCVINWFLGMEKWLWWFRPRVHRAWCCPPAASRNEWVGKATTGQSGRNTCSLPAMFLHLQPLQLTPLDPMRWMSHNKSISECLPRFLLNLYNLILFPVFWEGFLLSAVWGPCLCCFEPGSVHR